MRRNETREVAHAFQCSSCEKTFVNRQRQEERQTKRKFVWQTASSPNLSAHLHLLSHKGNAYTQSFRLNHPRCLTLHRTSQLAKTAKNSQKNLITKEENSQKMPLNKLKKFALRL